MHGFVFNERVYQEEVSDRRKSSQTCKEFTFKMTYIQCRAIEVLN